LLILRFGYFNIARINFWLAYYETFLTRLPALVIVKLSNSTYSTVADPDLWLRGEHGFVLLALPAVFPSVISSPQAPPLDPTTACPLC